MSSLIKQYHLQILISLYLQSYFVYLFAKHLFLMMFILKVSSVFVKASHKVYLQYCDQPSRKKLVKKKMFDLLSEKMISSLYIVHVKDACEAFK